MPGVMSSKSVILGIATSQSPREPVKSSDSGFPPQTYQVKHTANSNAILENTSANLLYNQSFRTTESRRITGLI